MLREASWTGSESQRRPQGNCSSNGYVPVTTHRFEIPQGTVVDVKDIQKNGAWFSYKTRRALGYARYESRVAGALVFREEGYWIRVGCRKIRYR